MKTSKSYGRKLIEPVLLESLDDLATEKVPRARPFHDPSGRVVRLVRLVGTGDTLFVRIRKLDYFEPIIRDEKPKIISLSETLLKAKLFFETELLNVKKWKRFPELNRLLGGFR